MATVAKTEPFSIRDEVYIPVLRAWLDEGGRSRLGLVVVGEAGQGKSSLINGLLGKEVAKEGDDLDSMTQTVEKFSYVENGIAVTLWDTPGFGMESDEKEEEILQAMAEECNPVDLMLYCIRMDRKRWPNRIDLATIRKITRVFGPRVWQHCQFVLTFANQVAGLCPDGIEVEQYFSEQVSRFEEKIKKTLKEEAKLSDEEAEEIRAVPVGDPHQRGSKTHWDLPDREDWFLEFWFECSVRINQSALPTLLRLNRRRIAENLDAINPPDDSVNPPERLYVRQVPDVAVSEEASEPHIALESPYLSVPCDEIPSSAEPSPMPSLTHPCDSGSNKPSAAIADQPPCIKQPDPSDISDEDESPNPAVAGEEAYLGPERVGISICDEITESAETPLVRVPAGTADNASQEQPNPTIPGQPQLQQEEQQTPSPGLQDRQIPLFRILRRQLENNNAGFKDYILTFCKSRGKQAPILGHMGGLVEGFFEWLMKK